MIKERRHPKTLTEAIRHFADPATAYAFVVQLRWPEGVTCPRCGSEKPSLLKTRMIWKCRECRRQFSVKVGTIFEDSPLGLDKWLPALWMLANCKNGISSYELARGLGVTQKTAWFMLSRIRLAMQTKTFRKLSGDVEADETFIGGKRGNMHLSKRPKIKSGSGHMQAIMGMLERKRSTKHHSTVVLQHIPNTRKATMEPAIRANVEEGSQLYTDAHPTYSRLAAVSFGDAFKHAAVDHAEKYVDGQVHTNGMENFWSLLKRTIKGTYVSVDPFHLFRYLDEQAFRFNNREDNDFGRFREVVRCILGKRLTYAQLISDDMVPATT